MIVEFSPEQKKAIETDGNVIVSAGAGSGKTTVMIERIVRKLLSGAKLDEMLIVTFTRAAAADIRVKLAERLVKLKRDPAAADKAARAADDMAICDIGTLHSFCQRLVKTYFYAAGIDPSASVVEENEAESLKYSDIKAAVAKAAENGEEYFMRMYDALSSRRNDDGVVKTIGRILDLALSLPEPRKYLTETAPDSSVFGELDGIAAFRRAQLAERIASIKADMQAAKLDALLKAADDLIPYMDGYADEIRRTSHRACGDYRDVINDEFKRLKKDCASYREFIDTVTAAKNADSAPYSAALKSVALDALERYSKRKSALGKIDYTDLEHGARRVLKDEGARAELAQRIKYVFIDEYQDINPLQAAISRDLKDCGAEMFLVGDIKQSIYAFRRCNPKYFKDATVDPDYTFVALNRNYRSSPQVIEFINNVFGGLMTDEFGGADYSTDKLVATVESAGEAEYCLVERADGNGKECSDIHEDGVYSVVKSAGKASGYDGQAAFIVSRVLDWLRTATEPNLGSIAVLVRSARTEFCAKLAAAFKKAGIACTVGKKSKLSDYPEAVALLGILRYVDNRSDDIPLYTALRSPMGGFSDEELLSVAQTGERIARARHVKPYVSGGGRESYAFWQKAENYKGELREKLDRFYALREEFLKYSDTHDSADTLGYITSKIDYFQYVFDAGGSAEAVEALISYAANRHCDVNALIDFCDRSDFELDVNAGGDSVTITTIHASKGLEFDYVIVADASHGFVLSDSYDKVIATENGAACKIPDAIEHKMLPSAPWLLESVKGPDRLRQEELRLFYVALTRAKRKLTVCGINGKRSSSDPRRARCELDFMGAVTPAVVAPPESSTAAPRAEGPLDESIYSAVKARCEFKYVGHDRPIKTCVTALAEYSDEDYTSAAPVLTDDDRAHSGDDVYSVRPRGKSAARSDADGAALSKLRGTAYHRAMELIDFSSPDFDAVKRDCENAELVDGDEILHAATVMRELTDGCAFYAKERYFIADMPLDEISGGGSVESMLVQGVIDLLIVHNDGSATIVDYKTTTPDRLASDAYRTQLKAYCTAVERVTPYKVKKAYLYSFILGKLMEI